MLKSIIVIVLLFLNNLFANESITICGTGDSQNLLKAIAKAYELQYPNTTIHIPKSIGSGGGIENTALGKCDLGRVARGIKKSEEKLNLNYILFAYSPVVFVANQNIKNVSNLTTKDIVGIYSGQIKKWSYFDKTNTSKIYVARRETEDSSLEVLNNDIQGYKDIENFAGKVIFNTPDTVKIIKKYKNTIGYLPIAQAVDTKLKIFDFNGVKPTSKNIKSGLYTIVLPFALVHKGDLNKLSKNFINFMHSTQVQDIYKQYGVITVLDVKD